MADVIARRLRLARPTVVTVLCALVLVLFGLGVRSASRPISRSTASRSSGCCLPVLGG